MVFSSKFWIYIYFKELTNSFLLKHSQYFSDTTGELKKIYVIDQNLKSQN